MSGTCFSEQVAIERHERSVALVSRFRDEHRGIVQSNGNGLTQRGFSPVMGPYQYASDISSREQSEERLERFNGWVFASLRPILHTIAALPFRVAKHHTKPDRRRRSLKHVLPPAFKSQADYYEDLTRHPMLTILRNPNRLMTEWHLKYITAASLNLAGKCHWWLTKEDEKHALWPIPSSWVTPVHDGRPFSGWIVQPGGAAGRVQLKADEIIYFYYPDPIHPLASKSPVQAISRAIVADESIQEAQARMFANGIWPGMAIVVGEASDDEASQLGGGGRPLLEWEQRQQIYAAVKRLWGGVSHFGEPLILDALIKDVYPLSRTAKEMDFLNSGNTTYRRITQGLGSNPLVMGETQSATRAAAGVARRQLADVTINPCATMISQTLTNTVGKSLSSDGEELLVYVEQYLPDDTEERRADVETAAKYGGATPADIRSELTYLPPSDRPLLGAEEHKAVKETTEMVADGRIDPESAEEVLFARCPSLDPVSIKRIVQSARKLAYRTVNERRQAEGLAPADGGDVVLVPKTLVPLTEKSAKNSAAGDESHIDTDLSVVV